MATLKVTEVLLKEAYPIVSKAVTTNYNAYKKAVSQFIADHHKEMYDIGPCGRIYYTAKDKANLYNALKIDENQIAGIISKTYYAQSKDNYFMYLVAQDPTTIILLEIVRHFVINKKIRDAELAAIYLAFSHQFYNSLHHRSFPKFAPGDSGRHIMEYVVNNKLSNKYDLKREGSVFGAIRSICNTWLTTYHDRFIKPWDDEEHWLLLQQLHSRIGSFMINIAGEYMQVYENKESYLTYDNDDVSEDSYAVADNDSLRIERLTENTMSFITTTGVDYKLCKMSSDTNVKTDEVKSIFESVIEDKDCLIEMKDLIRLLITIYFRDSKDKDVRSIDFISKSIQPKPNTKDPLSLKCKAIVEGWLDEKSPTYRKRKSRLATKNSYVKSVYTYIVLCIHESNK